MIKLDVLSGYTEGNGEDNRFILIGVLGHRVYGVYKAEGLRSMARLINNDPFIMTVDRDQQIEIPADKAIIMQNELNRIAGELDFINLGNFEDESN